MLQVEKNLYEIQEQINLLMPYVQHILNPYNSYPRYLYHTTDGTQYIDTQILSSSGTRIEMEFMPLTTDNSFIAGNDKLALMVKNGVYVFIIGDKLYTTNKSVVINEPVTFTLSKNGLTLDNKAYISSGNVDLTSDKTILISAGYDNAISNTFATLNSIDDIIDVLSDTDDINSENLMGTLNSIDTETNPYEEPIENNGISSMSSKRIYSFKLSDTDENNIRQYKMNLMPTKTIKNNIVLYCYYDMIAGKLLLGNNDTGFIKGAKDQVEDIAYDILNIENAAYNFIINEDDYYESTNNGIANSYSICRLEFEAMSNNSVLQLDCINYAENNYDYGVFSNLDTELTLSNNDDTATTGLVYKTLKGLSRSTPQPVIYANISKGSHFIDIKYRKDGSGNSNNDSLQFKVVKPTGGLTSVTKPDSGSYTFVLNSNGYYESNNKGVHSSYALCKVTFVLLKTSNVIFHCINYAESGCDYGILSNIDTTLTSSSSADSSNVKKSFSSSNSSSVQDITYSNVSAGEHFVYAKFRKDGSVNSNNDSLQFKVEIV